MPDIVLTTLNARYIHSALGLRYLLANMGELQSTTAIKEYVIETRPLDIVESLLNLEPKIIGFGVYIWNVESTSKIVALLKQIRPDIQLVIGGPEVSYEYDNTEIFHSADFVISGAADEAFGRLCRQILRGDARAEKTIKAEVPNLSTLRFPYEFYTDTDIAHRVLYVEASRGCPFKCEFCLSALDKTAWPFPLDAFLEQMQQLHERGARRFKFVDRTFNLRVDTSARILEFFLQRLDENLFLHFELIPDHLPEKLKQLITQFPPGSLQFEIGIQTFNPQVQTLISRRQDNSKSQSNLLWLRNETHAHLHTDLIAGLPGEDMASFAESFDQLVKLNPHEIQVGILKRLRGSPIIRHTADYHMVYNPHPPYNVLSTNLIDFTTMQRITRFARYWDMIANSGRFVHSLGKILGDQPFQRFMRLSDWLFASTHQTHKISLPRLFDLLYAALTQELSLEPAVTAEILWRDYQRCGLKKTPRFILENKTLLPIHPNGERPLPSERGSTPQRQARHLKAGTQD
ncbi:MAG: radical SAM protein [Gammaproteobacteria bacterium SG8_11]|nr:MAG: radical SAM protein [Gammaproteobacteria bacterium SG8_11]